MKRLFDFVCAFSGLVVLSPLLAILWLCIVAETGLPGLFRQRRVGRGGQDFTLLKFRSMTSGNRRQATGEKVLVDQGRFEAGNASRVTRVGRVLRNTKMDELPQLWNVLMGDMSLVGPRPEVRKWVEAYPDRWARVLAARPGITDQASITFRNEESLLAAASDPEIHYRTMILPRKLDLYEHYVVHRTFFGDIKIIFKTVQAVFM